MPAPSTDREDARQRSSHSRAFGAIVAVGVLVSGPLINRFRASEAVQDFFGRPLGLILVVLLAVVTLTSFVAWGRPPRRPLVVAVLVTTVLNTIGLMLANHFGWLRGTVTRPSLPLQALVYGLGCFGLALVPLALYRWLARYSDLLALLAYLACIAAFSALSVPAERSFLADGVYGFGEGYTMAADILWGVVSMLFTLALYQTLERSQSRRG